MGTETTPAADDGGHRDELRTLFLFESLTDSQLDSLSRAGKMMCVQPGPLFAEGDPATCLYVLVDGQIALSKRSGDTDIETVRTLSLIHI